MPSPRRTSLAPLHAGVALVVCAGACASGRFSSGGDDVDDPVDAAAADTTGDDGDATGGDGPASDAPPSAAAGLLLTEVVLAPTGGELVELYNPTGAAVGLRDYYLTDAPTYFRLPAGTQTVDSSDFIARFPAGASIPAGGVVTVAIDTAAAFTTEYPGVTPGYSLGGGTLELVAGSSPTLTNGGEPVVLFYWNGGTDLVVDVDIMLAGAPSVANALVDKSGQAIDGPDGDATATAYATDANTIASQASTPASGLSTKRLVRPGAATEVQSGGNGVGGRDETSEQTGVTWDAAGFTAPTPGAVPSALGT